MKVYDLTINETRFYSVTANELKNKIKDSLRNAEKGKDIIIKIIKIA